MSISMPEQVRVCEFDPSDGLQNEPEVIPTAERVRLVDPLMRTGLRRMEVTSFVRPDVIPQLIDAAEVLEAIDLADCVSLSVLIPNERGPDNALRINDRSDEVSVLMSASESHNRDNVKRSIEESLTIAERVIARARESGLGCEAVIASSFGCPYEGRVPRERVSDSVARPAAAGATEIVFRNTTRVANPVRVRRLFARALQRLPGVELTAYFHNTRAQGWRTYSPRLRLA